LSCLFCTDAETIHHLFFGCCVAKILWCHLSVMGGTDIGTDFESVAGKWLCAKKFKTLNICITAVLWSIWKLRNSMCFQENQWHGMQAVFFRCAKLTRRWAIIQTEEVANQLEIMAKLWEERGSSPPALLWHPVVRTHPGPSGPDDQEVGRSPPAASDSIDQCGVGLMNADHVIDFSSLGVGLEPVDVMLTVTQPVLVPCDDVMP
jgi:hypothetical protein